MKIFATYSQLLVSSSTCEQFGSWCAEEEVRPHFAENTPGYRAKTHRSRELSLRPFGERVVDAIAESTECRNLRSDHILRKKKRRKNFFLLSTLRTSESRARTWKIARLSSPLARSPHRDLEVDCKNRARPRLSSAPAEILPQQRGRAEQPSAGRLRRRLHRMPSVRRRWKNLVEGGVDP